MLRVGAAGGAPAPLTEPDRAHGEDSHRFPWFLPDGRHYLYTARNADRAKSLASGVGSGAKKLWNYLF